MATTIETKRGFVQRLEVGRAGLVVVTLLHDDGSRGEYRIPDLDSDPERFNERLSKLGLLRDAETRGEPVEIEFSREREGAPLMIERVTRITRDSHWLAQRSDPVDAIVVDVTLWHENRTAAREEKADTARVLVLTTTLETRALTLDMQIPERDVAVHQLGMILSARGSGDALRFYVEPETERILGVGTDSGLQGFGHDRTKLVDGFVEAISLIRGPFPGDLALVRFTTAPSFSGPGNVIPLIPFTQQTLLLLVFQESHVYALFEAGLRDILRMRVQLVTLREENGNRDEQPRGNTGGAGSGETIAWRLSRGTATVGSATEAPDGIALAAELLAPLAAAANPVWIKISRKSLDHGPDGFECTTGLPSSDLTPIGLRDLRIPYPATWIGWGCFNHGVYRFQLKLPVAFEISVDGQPLCVHAAEEGGIQFAHACLEGEHEVAVKIEGWTCDYQFIMDVYRIR